MREIKVKAEPDAEDDGRRDCTVDTGTGELVIVKNVYFIRGGPDGSLFLMGEDDEDVMAAFAPSSWRWAVLHVPMPPMVEKKE